VGLNLKILIKSIKFHKFKRLIKSKSFWGAFLSALALWSYTSLNEVYTPMINVPLIINVPKDKALDTIPPETVTVKVKGTGWQLFYLNFFNTAKRCIVNLTQNMIVGNAFIINRFDLIKGLENIVDVETMDVTPEAIILKLGDIETVEVPVNVIMSIKPRDGFVLSSKISVKPKTVKISGNIKKIKDIKFWNTQPIEIENFYKPTTLKVPLSDSLSTIVKLSVKEVEVKLDIQQKADLAFYDIPIKIRGGNISNNHIIKPKYLSVIVKGGVEDLANLSFQDIEAYIDYTDIKNDTTGIIIPKVEPLDIFGEVIINPHFVYHYRIIK